MFFNISIQKLNHIFSNSILNENVVVWMRSPDYQQQLYVSSSYEKIWKTSCSELFENPMSWNNYLMDNNIVKELYSRNPKNSALENTVLFKVNDAKQKVHFLKDTSFYLQDRWGNISAVVGICEEIYEQQWLLELGDPNKKTMASCLVQFDFSKILSKELDIVFVNENKNYSIHLTKRLQECLYFLVLGMTSKEIAIKLNLSKRTIEEYVNILKEKLNCRIRSELVEAALKIPEIKEKLINNF